MRSETDRAKVLRFLEALGTRVHGPGRVYLTGGGTAVLEGWREMTIDLDLKADPEPRGFFEAIAELKDLVDLNVELAAPDDFIPSLAGWRDRSLFIARLGSVDFYHYDPFAQALAKIERGHSRDLTDVAAMLDRGLIDRKRLFAFFLEIEAQLIRYPSIEPAAFRAAAVAVCHPPSTFDEVIPIPLPSPVDHFPGADLIAQGLDHARTGQVTIPACLVSIALPRLHRARLVARGGVEPIAEPELTLYRLLRREPGDAFSRYQALLRRLASFEHALDRQTHHRQIPDAHAPALGSL